MMTLIGHTNNVEAVAFSPVGRLLVSGTISLWWIAIACSVYLDPLLGKKKWVILWCSCRQVGFSFQVVLRATRWRRCIGWARSGSWPAG